MTDAAVRNLARRAGISMQWNDYAGKRHAVPLDAVRRILTALGLPSETTGDVAHSTHLLRTEETPRLKTATVAQPITLCLRDEDVPACARLVQEDGKAIDLEVSRTASGIRLPGIAAAGYHALEIGSVRLTLAVAPARCLTVEDIARGERVWGLAAQTYGLRSVGDCGIGDMAGAEALAKAAARLNADALALSPAHALFAADPGHFSPYSPSSRLFYNPLLADPSPLFGKERVWLARDAAGFGTMEGALERAKLIDWPAAGRAKMSVFRRLFENFASTDLVAEPKTALAQDFEKFRAARGVSLQQHALFETLHAVRLQADPAAWDWRKWAAEWREPASNAVRGFAEQHQQEILFHCFLQWIAGHSIAAAQDATRRAGMRIGLIADLAVGMNGAGSEAWSKQTDILGGVEIGAPADLFNPNGQNWGLTTFSPRALRSDGFAAFLATMRAPMAHAGGVRIDHAMGLMRLWVTPHGAKASEGAYLAFPLDDLLRLTALESQRHRAIVIGEDLGTVPAGFGAMLAATGIYGMRVLWFERDKEGFATPGRWPRDAAAMTTTHDLPTVAGWWRGSDLETRANLNLLADKAAEQSARSRDRELLWKAFQSARAADGDLPPADQAARVVDAAVRYIAETPSQLTLLPLEDALALQEQPNLPATIDEHPNWRRRYAGAAGTLLDCSDVRARLQPLAERNTS